MSEFEYAQGDLIREAHSFVKSVEGEAAPDTARQAYAALQRMRDKLGRVMALT